jgi:hypothetical protein
VEEKQIDVMMAIPRGDAKLPGDEAEIATEFEKKRCPTGSLSESASIRYLT